MDRFEDYLGLRVVDRGVAQQDKRAIHLLAREANRFDHPARILPPIEPGDLHHERTICRNSVVGKAGENFMFRKFSILHREWVDGWRDEALRDAKILGIVRQ